jgi:hypothetical protein
MGCVHELYCITAPLYGTPNWQPSPMGRHGCSNLPAVGTAKDYFISINCSPHRMFRNRFLARYLETAEGSFGVRNRSEAAVPPLTENAAFRPATGDGSAALTANQICSLISSNRPLTTVAVVDDRASALP